MSLTRRCKVGDLAMIVRSAFDENRGRLVKVSAPATFPLCDWQVKSQGSPLKGMNMNGDVVEHLQVDYPDSALQPIRPNDSADDTLTELYLKETA